MKPHPSGFGLCWCAFVVLIIGGTLAWAISLDRSNPDWTKWMSLVIAVTVVLTGLCIIAKLSSWWIRR
ncbi:MAG: hypothetical protein BWY59_01509 [Verrucomicrobia bacterium ADurb.Bin345]|nr:MAG: hypothetical protein BWY59_01509 [Verrucomicrobia bacterium ADurb.Bin345]